MVNLHAYIDLKIRNNLTSYEEYAEFNKIMENALVEYQITMTGQDIIWDDYKLTASEETMAAYISNLVKYRLILEKNLITASDEYSKGYLTEQELERKIE